MNASPTYDGAAFDVTSHLSELASQGPIHYVPNLGNAGDSMIAHATFQMFERLGIDIEPVNIEHFDAKGKIIVYGGGGSLLEEPTRTSDFLSQFHRDAKRLVVLPHTFVGHAKLWASMGPNVDLIAREHESLNYLKSAASGANLMIAHDLAFQINIDELMASSPGSFRVGFSLKRLIRRQKLSVVEGIRRSVCGVSSIDCYRTDSEQTDIARPIWNADLSKLFKCGVQTPIAAARSSRMIFGMLDHYHKIRTNRLHLAIAGAMLGKEVEFYPNCYFKCREVYEYSMRGRFKNVQWMG